MNKSRLSEIMVLRNILEKDDSDSLPNLDLARRYVYANTKLRDIITFIVQSRSRRCQTVDTAQQQHRATPYPTCRPNED